MATKKVILGKLTLRNFLSYGDNTNVFYLNRPGSNLILGENRDIGDEGSRNGVGKSTLMQAISVALFNQPITKIRTPNLVNTTNKKKMEISLEFKTDWNDKEYRVEIGQKPDYVRLIDKELLNDDTDHNGDIAAASKAEVVGQIEELLGINYKTFRYVVLFSASGEAFLDLSTPKQREIVESLFDMDIITEKAEGAKKLKTDLKKDLDFEQHRIKTDKEANDRAEKLLEKVKTDIVKWDDNKKSEMVELKAALKEIGNIDQETLADEIQLVDAIIQIAADIKEMNRDITAARKSTDALKKQLTKLDEVIVHLEDDNCPFCKQSMPDAKATLKTKRVEQIEVSTKHDTEDTAYNELKKQYKSLEENHTELLGLRAYDNLDEVRTLVNEKDNIEKAITDLKKSKNPHKKHLTDLKKSSIVKIDTTLVDELQDDFNHADFLLKLLNNKNSFIRKRIIGQVIPYMNKQLADYVDRLGLPHSVKFEDDLTATISQFGRELSFGNLSTGERGRVNLALSFAFRDVLGSMHTEFNLLALDEVLDSGLDEIGVYNTIAVLKDMVREKDTSIYLISHRPEVADILDNTITIVKEHGFSRIGE